MSTNATSGAGTNWSGIIIALIGALSTLAATWLTIQHSASGGASSPAGVVEVQSIAPAAATSPVIPQAIIVPDLRNVSVAQAQRQLATLGLMVMVANIPDEHPVGTVLSVTPETGQAVSRGSTVFLQVSAGLTPSTVPEPSAAPADKRPKGKKDN